jgi:chromate transport protein ChrA
MRLPLWAYPWVLGGAFLLASLLHHFGRLALARPIVFSVTIIIIAIAMRWTLRGHRWFWITMAFLAALHVPLILFIPWTTKWIPALVLTPIGIADLYAMLSVVAIVGNFIEGPKPAETREA